MRRSSIPHSKSWPPIRKALGVRTFFNILGPLVNPAEPKYQLLGVYNLPLLRLYTYTYQAADTQFTVVYSLDGYDEISLTAPFKVATPHNETIYTPADLGVKKISEEQLYGGDTPEQASAIFDAVLQGSATSAQKECVTANAAFAIKTICPLKSISECMDEARISLESGKALDTFRKFLSLNS